MPLKAPLVAFLAAVTLLAGACRGTDSAETAPGKLQITSGRGFHDEAVLSGGGSTFVEPVLRQWIERYRSVAPGVTINYESGSSASALEGLRAGDADFFARDIPLTELQEATLGGSGAVLQVPWAAGAIAVAYNLPDVGVLRLTPQTLAAIFAGRVQRWDDPAIRADNPDARLPALSISVIYRADASGTTNVFSSYLDAASGVWPLGTGSTVRFPRGTGVAGSEAVTAAVQRTTGAVGYIQLSWARRASLGVVRLGNRAGNFVEPTPEAVNAALAGANARPFANTAGLLFTPDSPGAYPLATLTYLMFRREGLEPEKRNALRHFAIWALSEGQRIAEPLGYTPVPRQFQTPALETLQLLTP